MAGDEGFAPVSPRAAEGGGDGWAAFASACTLKKDLCERRLSPMNRVLLAAIGCSLLLAHATRAGDGPVELVVDASRPAGTIRALHGVNGGPVSQGGTLDLSPAFREIGPPLIRLHDCHWPNPDVVDLHVLFPDHRADPALPGSYDFAATDDYLRSTLAVAPQVVFRLGESIEHARVKRHVHPPSDPARWAAACVGVIRHYNEGWAGGYRHNIRYWEIWNEPDNRPAMWTGTDEDYLTLYSTAAKAIKARFPGVRVGGPSVGNTGRLVGEDLEPAPFVRRFLEHCRREGSPLDFFSWHCYASDPRAMARRARAVRRLLDQSGFPKAESQLNEWNYLPGDDWSPMLSPEGLVRRRWYEEIGGAPGAAFTAAGLLLLQDAPLDAANYFSAEAQGMGLFDPYGVPKKSYYAFKAFRSLLATPLRLPVRGVPPGSMAACAGTNAGRSGVTVLLSKFGGPDARVTLAIRGLPWEGRTRYEVALLDGRHDLEVVRAGSCAGGPSLEQELRGPSVCLVKLRPAGPGD